MHFRTRISHSSGPTYGFINARFAGTPNGRDEEEHREREHRVPLASTRDVIVRAGFRFVLERQT
jgi:hypothetical protein